MNWLRDIAGFDFGCGTDVRSSAQPDILLSLWYTRERAIRLKPSLHPTELLKYSTLLMTTNLTFSVSQLGGSIFLTTNSEAYAILAECFASLTEIQTLDANNFAKYDALVQGCLATGAYCIIGKTARLVEDVS